MLLLWAALKKSRVLYLMVVALVGELPLSEAKLSPRLMPKPLVKVYCMLGSSMGY